MSHSTQRLITRGLVIICLFISSTRLLFSQQGSFDSILIGKLSIRFAGFEDKYAEAYTSNLTVTMSQHSSLDGKNMINDFVLKPDSGGFFYYKMKHPDKYFQIGDISYKDKWTDWTNPVHDMVSAVLDSLINSKLDNNVYHLELQYIITSQFMMTSHHSHLSDKADIEVLITHAINMINTNDIWRAKLRRLKIDLNE